MTIAPRTLERLGLALAALTLAWIGSGTLAALALTRRWSAPSEEPLPSDFTSVRLVASDGVETGAFLGDVPAPRAAVVLVHGNGSNRSALLEAARSLRARGHAVLPITVRAHGDSQGTRNDLGWSARRDVAAAVRLLERHLDETEHPGTPIVVLGISLGAAASVFAAAELGDRVSGYVLVGP
jgi:alpha-beta hydrolase superfamily lysophospholipase